MFVICICRCCVIQLLFMFFVIVLFHYVVFCSYRCVLFSWKCSCVVIMICLFCLVFVCSKNSAFLFAWFCYVVVFIFCRFWFSWTCRCVVIIGCAWTIQFLKNMIMEFYWRGRQERQRRQHSTRFWATGCEEEWGGEGGGGEGGAK